MIETKCRSWKRLGRSEGGKGKEYKRDDKSVMIDIKKGMKGKDERNGKDDC